MYERFTDRARKVMQLANQEAQRFNHDHIGTEHILLGLVKEGAGVAATILKNNDVDLRRVRLEVEKLVESGPETITMGKLPQTLETKKVMEGAMEEARNLHNAFVGTEHVLLGLIRVKDAVAYQVLTKLGLKLERLREETRGMAELNQEDGPHEKLPSAKKSKTPALDSFTQDITKLARDDKLSPVIGRRNEIDRITNVLSRKDQNSAVLVGDSGSGRRSIVHGLAQQIAANAVRQPIAGSRIAMLDQGLLVAGTKYRGQFEERVKALVNEMSRAKNIILFVPQIHSLTRLGLDDDAGLTAIELLQFAMFQNQIKCIGTCTNAEYDEHFEGDSDLQRLFQTIPITPPSIDETLEILVGIKESYECYHRVEIRDEALQAAVELSVIYLPNAVLPEKAIKLIDDASAQLGAAILPPDRSAIDDQIAARTKQKEEAILAKDFDQAAKLRAEIKELNHKADAAQSQWRSENTPLGTVEVQNIIAALSVETGVSEQDIVERKNIDRGG